MMKPKVYIDGQEGTTGLQIYERLGQRSDIDLLRIDPAKRKDVDERRKLLNAADLVFLCLPDAAAREAVSLIDNDHTRVIDASTAHRTAQGWVYGFAELSAAHRAAIAASKRVANPGCHATGLIASVYPLVQMGLLLRDDPLTFFSLTGYSGGGKKMIAEYESPARDTKSNAPRIYGLNLRHKHLPEMQTVCGLAQPPVFCPVVDDYYKGMAGTVLLHNARLPGSPTAQMLRDRLADYYAGQALVSVAPFGGEEPMLAANSLAGKDSLQLVVYGHEEQTCITALFDNLGKGASGAAVQNMNIMLGLDETTGLSL